MGSKSLDRTQNVEKVVFSEARFWSEVIRASNRKRSLLAWFDVGKCLELSNGDLGSSGTDTFASDQPTDHFALTRYNDRNKSAPPAVLGHLWTFVLKSFA